MANDEKKVSQQEQEGEQTQPEFLALHEFLLRVAPGDARQVEAVKASAREGPSFAFHWPPRLRLYCPSDRCGGEREFEPKERGLNLVLRPGRTTGIVTYRCRNCGTGHRDYSLLAIVHYKVDSAPVLAKIGEFPMFGGPLPQELLEFAGEAATYLVKGHNSESQGLGVGAFAYYRRFVDVKKNQLFQRIIEVAQLEDGNEDLIADLKAAKKEQRFAESMKAISHALPPVLSISGMNPLSLLYGALSTNLHGKSDRDCLQLATDVRIVLANMAERLANALADQEELRLAVHRLAAAKSKKRK